jgi:hypothetical protein
VLAGENPDACRRAPCSSSAAARAGLRWIGGPRPPFHHQGAIRRDTIARIPCEFLDCSFSECVRMRELFVSARYPSSRPWGQRRAAGSDGPALARIPCEFFEYSFSELVRLREPFLCASHTSTRPLARRKAAGSEASTLARIPCEFLNARFRIDPIARTFHERKSYWQSTPRVRHRAAGSDGPPRLHYANIL